MTTLNEGRHTAEFILSEGNGNISRDNVTVLGGYTGATTLAAGTVLGKITASGKYTPSPASGGDGSQTGAAVLIDEIDISDGDVEAAVISRNAEVNGNLLTYESSVNTDNEKATKAAELADVGIIVR